LERLDLLVGVLDAGDGSENMFRESRRVRALLQTQEAFLDGWREVKEHEDLGDPSAADTFTAGDGGLIGDFPGVELSPPFKGLEKCLDYGRRPGLAGQSRRLGRPGGMPRRRDGRDHAVGGHLAHQDADVAVLERPVRPERDLDGLLAEFDRTFDVVGGNVDNAEPDLWPGAPGAASNSGTFGEPDEKPRNWRSSWLTQDPAGESRRGSCVSANIHGPFRVCRLRRRALGLSAVCLVTKSNPMGCR